jgi:tetratricopeptide (TPR) repeat protein
LVTLSRPTEGLLLFDKLIESAPENPTVRQGRALALAQLGRKDEAVAEFKHVLDLQPDFGAARRELEKLQGPQPERTPGADAAKPAAATSKKAASETFTAPPIDVGPEPAPAVPQAERSQTPAVPGTFFQQREAAPMGPFRRPDSEEP